MSKTLIVEDDAGFASSLAEAVRDFGYEVTIAPSGEDALARFDEIGAALVFLDLRLRGMHGLEVLRALKSHPDRASAPVVILTAFADSANTIEAMKLGAFDHLTKPIGRDDIRAVLARALTHPPTIAAGKIDISGADELIGSSPPMREVHTLLGSAAQHVDVRVIAATRHDLAALVREEKFREDLFYRLNVLRIELPPLRERGTDILLLAEHFLRRASPDAPKKLSATAAKSLLEHAWPGNVRELENMMRSLSLTVRGAVIDRHDLHFENAPLPLDTMDELLTLDLPTATARLEKMLLQKALHETGGNRTEAARRLGIRRQFLYAKLKEHGL